MPGTEATAESKINLERTRGALVLWSDGHGIAQGQLADVFSRSRKLRRIITKTLSHVTNVLLERTWSDKLERLSVHARLATENVSYLVHEDTDSQIDAASASASDISSDSIGEIAEDLRTDAQYLVAIELLLKNPILDPDPGYALEDFVGTWNPAQLYADKIESRYPLADKDPITLLAEANFKRYLRCQGARDAQENAENQEVADETDVAGTFIAASQFHDSGIGTSIAPTTSYAETVMSYRQEGRSVRIPPLPEEA
ncbi:hypothetical protein B0T14DRAFT_571628 [Immersiella caudata]|uniref:Uncharacterized protein n=1 Tax=Immersiella caudata TaxID=314043 RepID=A0AA39U4R6_9PEZI|nr:hypothetical protein B0T14DRAFT_571628 [Immersiella caudata]